MPPIGIKHVDRDVVTFVFAKDAHQRLGIERVGSLVAQQPADAEARNRRVDRGLRRVDDEPRPDRDFATLKLPAIDAVQASESNDVVRRKLTRLLRLAASLTPLA